MFSTSLWRRPAIFVPCILFLLLTVFPQSVFAYSATRQSTVIGKSSQRSANAQSTNVMVTSDVVWKDTGISVKVGDVLNISATGTWSADPNDGNTGPDGYAQEIADNFLNLKDIGVCAVCASTPAPHWGALIGYIGSTPPAAGSYTSTSIESDAQKVFFVGSTFQSNATLTGELWLTFNDDAYSANTADNTGEVTATATDTPSVLPGGTWVSPSNGFIIVKGTKLHLAAHAYPSNPNDPPILFVNFTATWPALKGNWISIQEVNNPTPGTGDVFEYDWDLSYGKGNVVHDGSITISFDVYDVNGGKNLAPNGEHQGMVKSHSPVIHKGSTANYAGYILTDNSFPQVVYSDIRGSWIVPKISTCAKTKKGFTGSWVGLGGKTGVTLEQTGTASECLNGKTNYYAWYEMVPKPYVVLNNVNPKYVVNPGDSMQGEVQYQGNGIYTVTLQDVSKGWVFQKSLQGSSARTARADADWILENRANTFLPNFGTVHFTNCSVDGISIGSGPDIYRYSLLSNDGKQTLKAYPSALKSNGANFDVIWNNT